MAESQHTISFCKESIRYGVLRAENEELRKVIANCKESLDHIDSIAYFMALNKDAWEAWSSEIQSHVISIDSRHLPEVSVLVFFIIHDASSRSTFSVYEVFDHHSEKCSIAISSKSFRPSCWISSEAF